MIEIVYRRFLFHLYIITHYANLCRLLDFKFELSTKQGIYQHKEEKFYLSAYVLSELLHYI